jgi:uncharacterized membrane protein
MSFNMILLILGVVFGVAYFAKRSHRKQKEMRMRAAKQRQA